MRKKAERKIKDAAATVETPNLYRIDKIRAKTDLVRKVFDKTILDMARLGTIELKGGVTDGMSPSEIGNFIKKGDALYVYFSFLDQTLESESIEPETIDIELTGMDPELWQRFEYLCVNREGKKPIQKIKEMIKEYNRNHGENSYLKQPIPTK